MHTLNLNLARLKKGGRYLVRQNMTTQRSGTAFCRDYYPWEGEWAHVSVLKEYDDYYLVSVYPHRGMWGISKPYKVTLQKIDIYLGNIKVKGGE